jgi:hypothetical protein
LFSGGSERSSQNQIVEDLIHIGKQGGDLGFALMARAAYGDKLNVNIIADINNRTSNAQWANGQLDLNAAYVQHYQYLSSYDRDFLGDYNDSGAITIAHELGHAFLGIKDPFNVYIIENPIRKAFGRPLRTSYNNNQEDDPRKRGNGTGLIWSSMFDFPKEVSATFWLSEYISSQKARNDFIKKWSCQ